MTVEERRRRRFSEEFKVEAIRQLDKGELTITQLSKLYEVKTASIQRWVKKYGDGSYKSRIIVSFGEELDAIKEKEKEISNLRSIIADQQIELSYYKAAKIIAERELGPGFEKKG